MQCVLFFKLLFPASAALEATQKAVSAVDFSSAEGLQWQEAKEEVHFLYTTGSLTFTDVDMCVTQ